MISEQSIHIYMYVACDNQDAYQKDDKKENQRHCWEGKWLIRYTIVDKALTQNLDGTEDCNSKV